MKAHKNLLKMLKLQSNKKHITRLIQPTQRAARLISAVRLNMNMREISPAENMGADDFLEIAEDHQKNIVKKIRKEKINGERPLPSSKLIDS